MQARAPEEHPRRLTCVQTPTKDPAPSTRQHPTPIGQQAPIDQHPPAPPSVAMLPMKSHHSNTTLRTLPVICTAGTAGTAATAWRRVLRLGREGKGSPCSRQAEVRCPMPPRLPTGRPYSSSPGVRPGFSSAPHLHRRAVAHGCAVEDPNIGHCSTGSTGKAGSADAQHRTCCQFVAKAVISNGIERRCSAVWRLPEQCRSDFFQGQWPRAGSADFAQGAARAALSCALRCASASAPPTHPPTHLTALRWSQRGRGGWVLR